MFGYTTCLTFFSRGSGTYAWWKWREGVLCHVSRRYLVYAYMVYDVGLRIDFLFFFFLDFLFWGFFRFGEEQGKRGEDKRGEEEEVVGR